MRNSRDRVAAYDFATQRCAREHIDWHQVACVTQPLIIAPHLDEKRANLAKAIGLMNGLIVKPGQVLSVWHCLGPPTATRGWASGRTIINDVMTTDPGGGLCQFSSLIYHLGLLAGLTIIERHHHSRDIHLTDATRFTALGLDATIVYGFKDLRLRNDGDGELAIRFGLVEGWLKGEILAVLPLRDRLLNIERRDSDECRVATVSYIETDGAIAAISEDEYLL